jgi:hypothetical protein
VNFVEFLILLTVFLALIAGHYAPWHYLPFLVNKRGHLLRVPAYTYGVLCILLGMLAYEKTLLPTTQTEALIRLSIAAGLGTIIPRIILWLREMRLESKENHESTDKGRNR